MFFSTKNWCHIKGWSKQICTQKCEQANRGRSCWWAGGEYPL